MVTVGGIATRPRYVDGELQPREVLALTISVDHGIVDGAPAARFAGRLAELIENADGLSQFRPAGRSSEKHQHVTQLHRHRRPSPKWPFNGH
jgi:hypothetical protein